MKRRQKVPQKHSFHGMRKLAWIRQGHRCYWCGRTIAEHEVTGDHVVPLYAGGQTWPGNIVAACHTCNSTRNAAETNRGSGGLVATSGDDTPSSPFEILAKRT